MAIRIVGVDLPQNKRGEIGLTYIYGIGRSAANKILEGAGVDKNIKVKDWTDEQASKIREIIGSGGKTIKRIVEETGAKIDVEDDGSVYIASVDAQKGEAALKIIEAIVEDVELGRIYEGTVVKIADFGAFVQIIPGILDIPGKDGMVHISELMKKRVEKVTDLLKEGDKIAVKVINIDPSGKVKLSRKAAVADGIPEDIHESIHGSKAAELLK